MLRCDHLPYGKNALISLFFGLVDFFMDTITVVVKPNKKSSTDHYKEEEGNLLPMT